MEVGMTDSIKRLKELVDSSDNIVFEGSPAFPQSPASRLHAALAAYPTKNEISA